MHWSDHGIFIHNKRYGENSWVITMLTLNHGKQKGTITNAKNFPYLGSIVLCQWTARTNDQIGFLKYEELYNPITFVQPNYKVLILVNSICRLINILMPEHQKCTNLYDKLQNMLNKIGDDTTQALTYFCKIEWELLRCYGLRPNYNVCHFCNKKGVYVSPKSGRGVCSLHGNRYKDKLLRVKPNDYVSYIICNTYFFSTIIDEQHRRKINKIRQEIMHCMIEDLRLLRT